MLYISLYVVMVRLIIIIDAVVTFQHWMDFSVTY